MSNRVQETINGVTTNYVVDDNDRLLSKGTDTYSYDANGNTVSEIVDGQINTYTYDARNKLINAVMGSVNQAMAYDPDGARILKSVGGDTTDYLVDSNRDYAQVLYERSATTELNYTFGTDLVGLDTGSEQYTYHSDALGSTRALTNSAGTVADDIRYDAWGEVLSGGDVVENHYLYTGEQFDSALDKQYLRARYYDVRTGRLNSRDIWEGLEQNPETLHDYSYVIADPINLLDPTGLYPLSQVLSGLRGSSSLSKGVYPTYRFVIRETIEGLTCYALEETILTAVELAMSSGVYLLSDRGKIYTGETNDFERRLKQHKNDVKKRIKGTLARFEVVRQKNGITTPGNKNDRRIIEQLMMDFFDAEDVETTNKRKAVADTPKGPNSKKLRKILSKLDVC